MDADAPRWSPGSAVRKQDQFTAAPDFIDPHDSEHMPMWGRLSASWHGMAPQRRVVAVASLLVVAGAAAAVVAFSLADLGSQGPQGGASGPVAAHSTQSSGPLAGLPTQAPTPSNATAAPGLPTGSIHPPSP